MFNALIFGFLFFSLTTISFAQTNALIKRTIYKTETIEFGAGGTISIIGAPTGSIAIEGWQKNEVEISAEIKLEAETEEDLAQLAKVNGFLVDNSSVNLRVISVGTHDRRYVKQTDKNFPKKLIGMPYRIDYQIKVPLFSDLNVDGGKGNFTLSGVEGSIIVKYLESDANLRLNGGMVSAIFGGGTVDVSILSPSWRGRNADIQLAAGTMNVGLPPNLNAELDADVLRVGRIENTYEFMKPRGQTKFSDKTIRAKAGGGGAKLAFTVGDGSLNLSENNTGKFRNPG